MDDYVVSILGGGTAGVIITGIYLVYKLLKHSACRSTCCGYKSSLEVDLETGRLPPAASPPRVTVPETV